MTVSSPHTSRAARLIAPLARFTAPRHADLVRGMVAELESIPDAGPRRRFALGAFAAVARLSIQYVGAGAASAARRWTSVFAPVVGAHVGGSPMLPITPRQLARRHLVPFVVALVAVTGFMLALFGVRVAAQLGARGETSAAIVEAIALGLPFTMAMTVPMAVFLAVAWVFSRLGREGMLGAARRDAAALRQLLVPVLIGATTIAGLMFVSNTQLLPRANTRLAVVLSGSPARASDRTMTVGELRAAARQARRTEGAGGATRATAYEVEVQKKFAISAACIVLALAGLTITLRFPRGGAWLVAGSSVLVFAAHYAALVAGETLADRAVVSPIVAMWMANALTLVFALLLLRTRTRGFNVRGAGNEAESAAIAT
ncbi:MAG: LptF/LptG family permease [Gemmatimonadetes bacterium]|nr:LptF/LptG family permease [Gemmatimonadota bacterium]